MQGSYRRNLPINKVVRDVETKWTTTLLPIATLQYLLYTIAHAAEF
jgi:hypothetical protein